MSSLLIQIARLKVLCIFIDIELQNRFDFSKTKKWPALGARHVAKVSMAKTILFEVFSIFRPCKVGKIDKNKRM
jgi:hypothetical protein